MAQRGQTIYNCITTDLITFLTVREDTEGKLLRFETIHQPNGIGPVPYRHPFQEKTVKVMKGTFEITINRKTQVLVGGQQIVVPINAVHFWNNTGEEELQLITELRPALHFQELLETATCLSQSGKMDFQGRPKSLQWWATMNAYYGELVYARVPFIIQRFLYGFLGKIVRKHFKFRDQLEFTEYLQKNFIRSEQNFIL